MGGDGEKWEVFRVVVINRVQNPDQAEKAKTKTKKTKKGAKKSLEEAYSDQATFKETETKESSEVVLNRSKFIASELFDKIEIPRIHFRFILRKNRWKMVFS